MTKDLSVYLEKLAQFSDLLRADGLAVGLAETADAARILTSVGFEDRELVKAALMTIYAKSQEEQKVFSRAFDSFFVPEEVMRRQVMEQVRQQEEYARARAKAEEELRNGGPSDLTEEQISTYAMMPEEARQHLRDIIEAYKPRKDNDSRLYTSFIHSVFAKAILEQQLKMEDAGLGAEEADTEAGLQFRDITLFKDSEIPRATALIKNISARINGELSSKRKRAGHSGTLDFRRTIRKGLETGGSFHRLAYKKTHSRKKHLVLLCDVSGSMIQFSEFALRFIQEMTQVAESSHTFLFSESIFEADAFSLQNMDLFRDYVNKSGLYGRGTDLGTALEYLCVKKPPILNHSTTLLILSDAKTVDQPRALHMLMRAKQLAGQVLWLNPIPESKWKYLNSSMTFSSACTMLSCSTLHDLAAACKKLGSV